MTLPQIRIRNGWLLYENASVHLHKLWTPDEPMATLDEVDEWVEKYREAWSPYEEKLLSAACEKLGVQFYQNVIDVYIAPRFYAFSDPMVLGIKHEPNRFVELLAHELMHRLLTDNDKFSPDYDFLTERQKLFGAEHSKVTLAHIPVHAMLEYLFTDILNEPERVENDLAELRKNGSDEYLKAWDYVRNEGYETIIERISWHTKAQN